MLGTNKFKRLISNLIAFSLVFSLYNLPAAALSNNAANNVDSSIKSDTNLNNQPISPSITQSNSMSEAQIVSEDVSKRTANAKTFLMDNGAYQAVVYPFDVHYQVNGKWEDINNSVSNSVDTDNTAVLNNNSNNFKVKFAKKSTSKKLVNISVDNNKISWYLADQRKVDSQVINTTPDESKMSNNDKKRELKNISSDVKYDEILPNVCLEYFNISNRLKENIILKNSSAQNSFSFVLDVGKLAVRLNDDKTIDVYDPNTNKLVYSFVAPYMYDANHKTSNNINVSLTEKKGKGTYLLTITANKDLLNDTSTVYPVTIDPQVLNTGTAYDTNVIDDTYVQQSNPNSTQYRLYEDFRTGISSSGYKYRGLLKFLNLPNIGNSNIYYAQLRLKTFTAETNQGVVCDFSRNPSVSVYEATAGWDSRYATWNSMGWGSNLNASYSSTPTDTKLIDHDDYYWFNVSNTVNDWYTGRMNNNGFVLRLADESNWGYRDVFWTSSDWYYRTANDYPYLSIYYYPRQLLCRDCPVNNTNETTDFNIGGWALNSFGISGVYIYIDGVYYGQASYGGYRPDVANVYPGYPNATYSGFNYPMAINRLSIGTHTLGIRCIGTYEETWDYSNITVSDVRGPTGINLTADAHTSAATATNAKNGVTLKVDPTKINDDISGVNQSSYQFSDDRKTWTAASSITSYTPILSGDGPHTYYVRVQDNAGNPSDVASVTVYYDSTAPTCINLVSQFDHASAKTATNSITGDMLTAQASDNLSGIKSNSFRFELWDFYNKKPIGNWSNATSTAFYPTPSIQGINRFFFKVSDNALNESNPDNYKNVFVDIFYDSVPPTINCPDYNKMLTITPTIVDINSFSADTNSGVAVQKWATGVQSSSYFTTGGTAFTGSSFTVPSEGQYTIYAKDYAGNQTVKSVTVDTTAPTVACDRYVGSKTVSPTITDASGIATELYISGNYTDSSYITSHGTSFTGSFTVTNDGDYTLYVKDKSGNESIKTVTVDTAAPSITAIQQSNWTNGNVTINTAITDNQSGMQTQKWASGSQNVSYFESQESGTVFTGSSFEVPTNGTYTIYAKDNAGNESVQTISVDKRDITAPSVIATQQSAWSNGNVTVNAVITDNQSGVGIQKWAVGSQNAGYFESENNGITFTGDSFTVAANGTYTVYAKDNAGNASVQTVVVDKNDSSNPIITCASNISSKTIAPVIHDDNSGIAEKKWAAGEVGISDFSTDGTTFTDTSFEVPADGTYTIYARDNAGNQTVQKIVVDTVSPVINCPAYETSLTVTANISDDRSGIAVTKWESGTQPASYFVTNDGGNTFTGNSFNVPNEGTYTIFAQDNAGNTSVFTMVVGVTAPTIICPAYVKTRVVSPTITHFASDIAVQKWESGVKDKTYFTTGGNNINGNSFEVPEDGTYTMYVRDLAGLETLQTVVVDTVASSIECPAYVSSRTISPTISDATSGVVLKKWEKGIQPSSYFTVGGNVFTDSFNVLSDGIYTVYVIDNAGNTTIQTVIVDTASPQIVCSNFVASKSVTPAITDTTSGVALQKWTSGSKNISYFAENGTTFTGSSFDVSDDGTYTIYAIDKVGNATIQTVVVDTTVPVITCSDIIKTKTVSTNIMDATSGISLQKWAPGSQNASYFAEEGTTYSGDSFEASVDGIYTIYAIDKAENKTIKTVVVDTTSPVVSCPDTVQTKTVSLAISDATSGISIQKWASGFQNVSYFSNQENGSIITGSSFDVSTDGIYTIYVKDIAGNETVRTVTVDTTPPAITGVINNAIYTEDTTISFNEGTATLNGENFANGSTVSAEGKYTLVVTDMAGNVSSMVFTIDKTGSTITSPDILTSKTVTPNIKESTGGIAVKKWASGTQDTTFFKSSGTVFGGSSFDVPNDGAYTIYVKDNAGFEAVKHITVDTIAPNIQNDRYVASKTITPVITDDTLSVAKTLYAAGTQNPDYFASGGILFTGSFTVQNDGDYTIYAVDSAGNVSVKVITVDTTTPAAPTGLALQSITNSSVTLVWDSALNPLSPITYNVYRNDTLIGTTKGTSYVDTGLTQGTAYTYKAIAANSVGKSSASSAKISMSLNIDHSNTYDNNGVSAPSGVYSMSFTDLSTGGSANSIAITRTYNSLDNTVGSISRGWTLSYEGSCKDYEYSYTDSSGTMQIFTMPNIKVVKLPNGSSITYQLKDNVYVSDNSRAILVKNSDGSYTLTTKDQAVYTFDSHGYLTSITDKNGNITNINVNSKGKIQAVTNAAQQVHGFSYNAEGRISSISDPLGRTVQYQYVNGNLDSVIDPTGHVQYQYSYDSNGYLCEIKDAYDATIESIIYNHLAGSAQNKVQNITDSNNNLIAYAYDNDNNKKTKIDRNGYQTIESYNSDGQLISLQDAEGKTSYTQYYNKIGDVKSVKDANGNTTLYEIDGNGNITKITNPDGSTKLFTYDSKNNCLSQTDEAGKKTFYVYDSKGNLLLKAQPINGTDVYTQGCDESKFAITRYVYFTDAENNQLGYKVKGLLKQMVAPDGTITLYTYDANGNVESVKQQDIEDSQKQNITTNTYNNIGWLQTVTTPMGYTTTYDYDKSGKVVRMKQVVGGVDCITRYVYDANGRLIQQINPNQYDPLKDGLNSSAPSLTYNDSTVGERNCYDGSQRNVQSTTDALNNTTYYTYDSYGNVSTLRQPNGSVYTYYYDSLNRLKEVWFQDNYFADAKKLQSISYIIVSGQTQKTVIQYLNDKDSATTISTYDYAGRLISQKNPDGTSVSTQYNSNGTVNCVTSENGGKTYSKYDGLNRLAEQWKSIDTQYYLYTSFKYDTCRRKTEEKTSAEKVLLWSVPSTFLTTSFTYYSNGKLKSQTDETGRKTVNYYDDDGFLTKTEQYINATDIITTVYVNNSIGKPVKSIQYIRKGDIAGNDYTDNTIVSLETNYTYDSNGNLKTVTTPNLVTTTYTYDALNRQTGVSTNGLDEFGKSVVLTTSKTYTWDGKTLTSTDANGNITHYVYDRMGNLTQKIDANGGITASYYDLAGRVIAVVSANNYDSQKDEQGLLSQMNRTEYTYDLMGRVVTVSQIYFNTQTNQWVSYVEKAYQYDAQGNVIKELDGLGYAAGTGSTVSDNINSGYGTQKTYNLANQMTSILDPVSKENNLQYSVKYDYDALGRKISETNANGVITHYFYDSANNVTSITVQKTINDSEQITGSRTYDYLGHVLTQTDGNGNTIIYQYNNLGQVRQAQYPGDSSIPAQTVYYQYDFIGNLINQWDTTNKLTVSTYDNQGRLLSKTEGKIDGSESVTTTNAYDKNGNVRFSTDGNGVTTECTYNCFNKVITQIKAGHTTTNTYDANGNLLTTTDWLGNVSTNVYDSLNRLVSKADANNNTIQRIVYNNNNSQIESYDALGHKTTYTYDRNNRLLSATDALNHTTSQTYDAVGNISSKTDANNNITQYKYNEFNKLYLVINALGEETRYTYDLNGNVLSFIDGKNNVTLYEYNVANKQTKIIENGGRTGTPGSYTYDLTKVESYTYYPDSLLASTTDKNGNVTTYTYDSHGRMLSKSVGDLSITYTYDNDGNLLTMTDSTGTTTRTYDAFGRVTSKTVPFIGTSTYAYDIITNVPAGYTKETTTDPKANVTEKVYDKVDRLVQVMANGQSSTYTYNADGSVASLVNGDGSREDYTYYLDNTLHTLINTKADNTVIETYTYTYDAAKNMLSKNDAKGTTAYTYDTLNRLSHVTEPSGKVTCYTYDAAGNRYAQTISFNGDTTVTTYTYDNQNRLLNTLTALNNIITRNVEYSYDNNGNELSETDTNYVNGVPQSPVVAYSYSYDKFNQMIGSVSSDGTTVNNVYNGDGLRVEKAVNGIVTKYLYDIDKIVLEVDGTGSQTGRNIYGINLITRQAGTDALYYMYNGHADVTNLLDTASNIVASYYYDAFGNITEQTGNANNNILYGGYQYDKETGLYYLNARMYDPVTARFMQEDTYRGQYNDPLSLNLYTYCHNEPLMYSDPTGHWDIFGAFKNIVNTVYNGVKKVANVLSNPAKIVNVVSNFVKSTVNPVSTTVVKKDTSTASKAPKASTSPLKTFVDTVSDAATWTLHNVVEPAVNFAGGAIQSGLKDFIADPEIDAFTAMCSVGEALKIAPNGTANQARTFLKKGEENIDNFIVDNVVTNKTAYYAGRTIGDVASATVGVILGVQGVVNAFNGVKAIINGAATAETVIGPIVFACAGAATAVAGAAETVYGGDVVRNSFNNAQTNFSKLREAISSSRQPVDLDDLARTTGKSYQELISQNLSKTVKINNTEVVLPNKPHTNGTEGHWEAIVDDVIDSAQSGDYTKIYANRGIGNEVDIKGIEPNRRPDIMKVRDDGRIDQVEVQSKTDKPEDLLNRMRDNQSILGDRAGTIIVKPPKR